MTYDYSKVASNLIPAGTVAIVLIHLRPGGVGEDGLLKHSGNGECQLLDIEYVVVDGPYARRKTWENQIVEGTTQSQKDMADSYRRKRKAILESARNIKPGDTSPQARAGYAAGLKDFDGLMFLAKFGIAEGKDGYEDKNTVTPIVPGRPEYRPVVQTPPSIAAVLALAPRRPTLLRHLRRRRIRRSSRRRGPANEKGS